MKKQLVLDVAKWRCGGKKCQKGEGDTLLLNKEGYMCCLGQFTKQLIDVSDEEICNASTPQELQRKIPVLTKKDEDQYINTYLAMNAMNINDNELTTPREKIEKLKKLFAQHGYEIIIQNEQCLNYTNMPKEIPKGIFI